MPSKETSSAPETSDETQMRDESDYEAHSGALPSSSVYDFLYQDVRRVGSFLAQFEEHGVRQSIKSTESAGRSQSTKGAATGTIGLPTIFGGSAAIDSTTIDDTKDIAEHTFDPLWANSRRLLNHLYSHDLLDRDIENSRIGRFIIINGFLSIINTSIVNAAVTNGEVKDALINGAIVSNGIAAGSNEDLELRQNFDFYMSLPSNVQMFLFHGNYIRVWAALTDESLVTSAADLAYKHGSMVRGYWNVVGIVDAIPDAKPDPTSENPDPKTLEELSEEIITSPIANIATRMTTLARVALGRPRNCYGITPLLIFREVSGQDIS